MPHDATTPRFGPVEESSFDVEYLRKRRPRRSLVQETVLPAPLDEVFPFFSDAANLRELTPDWMRFRIVTPLPIDMKEGALIDYRIQLGPVPVRWRTRIEIWDPPHRFADSQLHGPYRCWWHEHRFEGLGDRTKMVDRVLLTPAPGLLGHVVAGPFVERTLRRIFEYRAEAVRRIFS